MPAAQLDYHANIPSAVGSDTFNSSCALYGLPVWPESLFTVDLFGSHLQYVAPMATKPGDPDILFMTLEVVSSSGVAEYHLCLAIVGMQLPGLQVY